MQTGAGLWVNEGHGITWSSDGGSGYALEISSVGRASSQLRAPGTQGPECRTCSLASCPTDRNGLASFSQARSHAHVFGAARGPPSDGVPCSCRLSRE